MFAHDQSPETLPKIKTAFSKSIAIARAAQTPGTLVHGDLWYENMIFDGEQVLGVIDFEAVSVGHPLVDFMTQAFLGYGFSRSVIQAFQKYGAFQYDENLATSFMFLRELRGLDYGIQTQDVDEDSLAKVAAAAAG